MGFTDDLFWKAWRWSQFRDKVEEELKKGELTKEEYKSHKTCFDLTTSIVKEKFFGDLKDLVKFKEKYGKDLDIEVTTVNPTIGSHCGPDAVGVAFYAKHR